MSAEQIAHEAIARIEAEVSGLLDRGNLAFDVARALENYATNQPVSEEEFEDACRALIA